MDRAGKCLLVANYGNGSIASLPIQSDGKLAEPVAEITVAGHALEMFASLTPANDLVFRRGTDSPTVRVEGLTMAGA